MWALQQHPGALPGWAGSSIKARLDAGEKGRRLAGALAPYAQPWAEPLRAGVLLLKWFHLRFGDLTVESRGHLFFLGGGGGGSWKGCWGEGAVEAPRREAVPAGRGRAGSLRLPGSGEGGGLEGREP